MKIFPKVILIAFLWLTVVNAGTLGVIDAELRLQMAHAWWTGKEEVQLAPDAKPRIRGDIRFGVVGADNRRYIAYDPGQAMLMLPGDWLGAQLHQWFPSLDETKLREFAVSFLIFVPLNTAIVASCYWLLTLFGFSEQIAGLSSIAWLLGTTMLHYAQVHQQNNQLLFFVGLGYAAALAYILRKHPYFALFSGFAMSAALLVRITSLIHIGSVILFFLGCLLYQTRNIRQIIKSLSWWVLGFIPLVLVGRILDYIRYGSFWTTARYVEKSQLGTDPMWSGMPLLHPDYPLINQPHVGILGPIISPAKSLFIYDPFLLPGLILVVVLWRTIPAYMRWFVITLMLDLSLHLVAYGRYFFWHGDTAWGARYHVTSIELLLIPIVGLIIQKLLSVKGWRKRVLQAVIAFAITVQLASVTMPMDLEIFQIQMGMPGSRLNFRLGQRLINISCLVNQEWSTFCTKNYPNKQERLKRWNTLAFWPQNLNRQLKISGYNFAYGWLFWLVWLVVLLIAVVMTLKFAAPIF